MVKRIVTAVVTVFMGIGFGVLLAFAGHNGTAVAAPPSSLTPPSASSAVVPQPIPPLPPGISAVGEGYYIKEYRGRVSVLRGDSQVPEMIFDISTKMLPELDRQQLAQGIYVETYEELVRLVEDYIS